MAGRQARKAPTLTKITLQSAEEMVYEALRHQVVYELGPGDPLPLVELASRLGVSTMPVRAALSRLEQEGLVRTAPRRNAEVAPMSLKALSDVQDVRLGLESVALRRAMAHPEALEVGMITALHERLERIVQARSRSDSQLKHYLDVERDLKDHLFSASGNAVLTAEIDTYRRAAVRYIWLALQTSGDLTTDSENIRTLVDRALAGDLDGALLAIERGLTWTSRHCAEVLFADD